MGFSTEIVFLSIASTLCLWLFSAHFANSDGFIQSCIAGDKSAWNQFVQQYRRVIFSAINSTLKKYAIADINDMSDEIFQNIFVKLHKNNYSKLKQFNHQAKFSTWLTTVAIRTTIDHIKRPERQRDSKSIPISEMNQCRHNDNSDPLTHLINKLKKERLEDKLKTLSNKEQLVIQYSLNGYDVADISNLMNDKENNISAIKHRAKTKLQKIFSESSK